MKLKYNLKAYQILIGVETKMIEGAPQDIGS
ncbi:hypothetical protein A2U01_0069355, partial [Trifolium medium]|nr:hypothetical protein [Trifolium medium]